MARSVQRRVAWLATACIAAVALLAIAIDHRAHALGVLPYLLLLACPFMHLLHGGHHGHSGPRDSGDEGSSRPVSRGSTHSGGNP
jgi:hypothetical protein